MASKNIEINIKNSTDTSGASSDTYTALYPKSLSKNIMYDNDSNITMQDKINNLTPNDTFELGDILCTSKINVDTEKWKLCDGSAIENIPSINLLHKISNNEVYYISTNNIVRDIIKVNDVYFGVCHRSDEYSTNKSIEGNYLAYNKTGENNDWVIIPNSQMTYNSSSTYYYVSGFGPNNYYINNKYYINLSVANTENSRNSYYDYIWVLNSNLEKVGLYRPNYYGSISPFCLGKNDEIYITFGYYNNDDEYYSYIAKVGDTSTTSVTRLYLGGDGSTAMNEKLYYVKSTDKYYYRYYYNRAFWYDAGNDLKNFKISSSSTLNLDLNISGKIGDYFLNYDGKYGKDLVNGDNWTKTGYRISGNIDKISNDEIFYQYNNSLNIINYCYLKIIDDTNFELSAFVCAKLYNNLFYIGNNFIGTQTVTDGFSSYKLNDAYYLPILKDDASIMPVKYYIKVK